MRVARRLACLLLPALAPGGPVAAETPVDINALRASLIARYPDNAVELRIRAHGRIHFFENDQVRVYPKTGNDRLVNKSTITVFEGNRFCIAEDRNWSGVCISMYRREDGQYLCEGQFGNGYGYGKSDCWIKILN